MLNYALIYREIVEAIPPKPKTKSNSESVWVRGELQKVIKYGILNVNTAYEALSHFI